MALLVLLLPEPVIAQIKYWGSGFGKWWSYLVEFAFPLLLAVAFFIIDKATAGTWWAKRVGE